jgi:hypothetical protein
VAESGHLLFIWKPTGYELREADGDPPEVGTRIEAGENGTYFVSRIGPSPRPGDSRRCAYLQPVP